ncbi:MAG: hypothetical protein M9939_01835 [Mesorhizobium sp.]|nr:hypothetical protein [Mesorhizobium sp.]MCO5159850.1 hypothetical protein [Mesorhizobium sp.]
MAKTSISLFLLGAALSAVAVWPAAAQAEIATELQTLKAEIVSVTVKSLPPAWTGGETGLSLVFSMTTKLEASLNELEQEQRDAAKSICHKVGISLVALNRPKPGLERLRFLVVEMKRNLLALGPIQSNATLGLVFDATNDCVEMR